MTRVMRSGIVGTGFMSRVHAQAVLSSGGTVSGIVGSSLHSAQVAADRYPGAVAVEDIGALVDLGVDVIHVCTPNQLHLTQAREALQAGIAVVCEKPLATSLEDAAELADLARSASVVNAVPFVYRYYPLVLEARARIAADATNRLWMLHGSYLQDWLSTPSSTNWRVDRNVGGASRAFGDIGVHWVDLMEFVTGQRITRLSARIGNAFERDGGSTHNGTEDGGIVTFETDAGALGSVVVSQASAGRSNRLWFSFDGPNSSYSFDQETPETLWVGSTRESRIVVRNPAIQSGLASRPDALPAGHPQGYQTCFNDLIADVYSALAGNTAATMPTFDDGLRAAILTEAVLESSLHRSWVDVPEVHHLTATRN